PLLLDLDRLEGTAERLQAVRERLRSVPHHGLGFGLLRYLGDPLQQSRLAAGRLQATWTYSTRRHRRGTVAALAAAFTAALRSLLPDAISANVALTPAAFSQARISQDELDRLLAGLVAPEDGGAA